MASETRSDRKQQRDIQEARQAGTIAPATDAVTGQMINPHNPEFITKRPWYLQQQQDLTAAAPSLQHQTNQRPDKDRRELSLSAAEELLQLQRKKEKSLLTGTSKFVQGQWVEALKKNKAPYRICQVVKVHNGISGSSTQIIDVQYEDGTIETKLKINPKSQPPRVRKTATGNRYGTSTTMLNGNNATKSDPITSSTENDFVESFVSKRDQYHGYDIDSHNATLVRKYEQKNEIRRKIREQQQKETEEKKKKGAESNDASNTDSDSDSDVGSDNDDDESDDEFVQRDEDDKVLTTRLARQGGVGGAQMKVTARNLRIREDTAKYLYNLDTNSAYYDPKSRSMRDNPHPHRRPGEDTDYAGDNFVRISGDAVALAQQQLFAWDAAEKIAATAGDGSDVANELHPLANPSQVELLQKQFHGKSQQLQMEAKRAILDKYGGSEYLDGTEGLAAVVAPKSEQNNNVASNSNMLPPPDRQLRFGVSTQMEEYTPDGRLVTSKSDPKGKQRKALESKYDEDVFINGHTTVWGSYFHIGAFTWGYADDHSLMKNSYCTGQKGRIANDEANAMQYGTGEAGSATLAQVRKMLPPKNQSSSTNMNHNQIINKSKLYGEVDVTTPLDEQKVQDALKRVKQEQQLANDNGGFQRKRKYNSNQADDEEMTPEMIEAYRIQKTNTLNDPMAKFHNDNNDELLEYK